jgi:hypothetical protein
MGLFGRQAPQQQTVTTGPTYCIGTCTCGQDCRTNTDLHTQITGALTCDDWTEEKPCNLPEELDDELFERAMALLGGGQ